MGAAGALAPRHLRRGARLRCWPSPQLRRPEPLPPGVRHRRRRGPAGAPRTGVAACVGVSDGARERRPAGRDDQLHTSWQRHLLHAEVRHRG